MKSSSLKKQAIHLRKKGYSYSEITEELKIPKATLSNWVSNIKLTKLQKKKIRNRWLKKLEKAREKAAEAHREEKKERLAKIDKEAKQFVDKIKVNKKMLRVFLVALYLADGTKREGPTELGSSNPKIAKTFITLLKKLYNLDGSKFRCSIFARHDQNPEELEKYWSNLLNVPRSQFYKTQLDKRTKGTKTYPYYKGVCLIIYLNSAIQRKITSIGNFLLEKILEKS